MTVMVHTEHDWMIIINDDHFPAHVHWVCQICGVHRDFAPSEDDPSTNPEPTEVEP